MVTRREDGPLLAVMGSLIIGILGGVAPPLSKVKMWHMDWLWRMSPGVGLDSNDARLRTIFADLTDLVHRDLVHSKCGTAEIPLYCGVGF